MQVDHTKKGIMPWQSWCPSQVCIKHTHIHQNWAIGQHSPLLNHTQHNIWNKTEHLRSRHTKQQHTEYTPPTTTTTTVPPITCMASPSLFSMTPFPLVMCPSASPSPFQTRACARKPRDRVCVVREGQAIGSTGSAAASTREALGKRLHTRRSLEHVFALIRKRSFLAKVAAQFMCSRLEPCIARESRKQKTARAYAGIFCYCDM